MKTRESQKFNRGLPLRRDAFQSRWRDSLHSLGGSYETCKDSPIDLEQINVGGEHFPRLVLHNAHANKRHQLMREKPPALLPADYHPNHRLDRDCPLCRDISRAELARLSHQKASQIIAKLPHDLRVISNLYPVHPLHSLVLSLNHDDLQHRAEIVSIGSEPSDVKIPATPGKTRARLLIPEELAVIFEFAAKHELLALHNHPLSGMSLPLHDHWHVHPLHRLFRKYFRHIIGGEAARFPASFRAKRTLTEIAVIGGEPSLAALAAKTASIFNCLEAQNIVTTLLFNPSRGGQVLICVLDPAVPQELKSRLGCLPMLNRLRETELVGGLRAPARPGTVNWHELTGGLVTLSKLRV